MNSEAPVTTRVRGGASARMAVVLVVAALAVIVGAAFLNRPPAPQPAAQVVAGAATPTAILAAVSGDPPTSGPLPRRSLRGVDLGDDAFSVIAMVGGRQYPIVLRNGGESFMDGWARLPYPRPDMQATVQLAQLWTRDASLNFQSIGSWSLPLDVLMPEVRTSATVLSIAEIARPLTGENRLVRNGFSMDIRLESRKDFGMIFVSIHTPYCGADGGTACLDVHRKVYGEDGIFGLPGWPWRADDNKTPAPTVSQPPHYVIKWLGRVWPGPGQKLTR
jgi:hypothetical protein